MIRNLYKKNTKVKIIVLFCSFILWIYVMGVVDPIVTRDITVNDISFLYENTDNSTDFIPIDDFQTIRIRMKGHSSEISNQISKGISVSGIISNPKVGKNTVLLKTEISSKIHYEFIPDELEVTLDTMDVESRTIDVEVINESSTNQGFNDIQKNIAATYVEGASSELKKVEKIVATINLEGKNEDFSEKLELYAVDKNGKRLESVQLSDKYVFVKVSLNHSREMNVIPNIVLSNGQKVRLSAYSTIPSKVSIVGSMKSLDESKELYTKEIPYNKISEYVGSHIILNELNGLTISSDTVELVRVAENIKEKELQYNFEDITLKNFTSEEEEQLRDLLKSPIILKVSFSKELDSEIIKNKLQVVLDKKNMDQASKKALFKIETLLPIDTYELNQDHIFLNN